MLKESIKSYSYRVSQASRSQLVVIMYDMAIEYLNDALAADASDTPDAKFKFCDNVKYAKRVIDELSAVLDMQYDLSKKLFQIYQFMSRTLVQAMAQKDAKELAAVIRMLTSLRSSFDQVSKEDQSGPLMNNVQQVYAGFTYSNAGSSNEFTNNHAGNRGYTV